MVTRGNTDVLKDVLDTVGRSHKWDLIDVDKRDAWKLKTIAALRKEKEVWASVISGRPTAAMIKMKNTSLTKAELATALAELEDAYDEANAKGFRLLVERIDYEKRPALATQILKEHSNEDGHALWQLIEEACSDSSMGKQESARAQYEKFNYGKEFLMPTQLGDKMFQLEALWCRIHGNDPQYPQALIGRALR